MNGYQWRIYGGVRGGQDPPTYQGMSTFASIKVYTFIVATEKWLKGGVQFEIQGTEVHLKNTDLQCFRRHLSII